MLNENKLNNLHQFLTKKNSISSKKVSLNIKSETTSPSSYNERNYSTQSKRFNDGMGDKNNQIPNYIGFKKSNTIDKNCYNNISLLSNIKDQDYNVYDSFYKELNKSNISNSNIISAISVSKSKNGSFYDKPIFFHIMKYFTRKSKNEIIKNDVINFLLNPVIKILNNNKKNVINIKSIKKELEEKNSLKFVKKAKNNFNSIDNNINENNINNTNEIKNCIGVDENFNLTFGKKNNREISTQSNNGINKNNNKKLANYIFNINNFKNNISTIKKRKNSKEKIDINPQSQRNSDTPILISEKTFKNKKLIEYNNMNKEESTPSFLKENNKINSKTSNQFKCRKINLKKNGINLDIIKLNNPILQNILNRKKNTLKNKEKKLGNVSNKNDKKGFDSSRLKVMENQLNIIEEKKTKNNKNMNYNLNYFNRDSSKKNYK